MQNRSTDEITPSPNKKGPITNKIVNVDRGPVVGGSDRSNPQGWVRK